MNRNKPDPNFHKESYELGKDNNHNLLDVLSYDLAVVLMDGVYDLAEYPAETLSRLQLFLAEQFRQKRDHECAQTLRIVTGSLGIEYDVVAKLLRNNTESRNYFLYAFIADLAALLEDIP